MLDEKPGLRALRSRIVQLRAMPGFAMLDIDTLALLAESSRVRRFRRGDVLLRAGAPVEHVYMSIEEGIEVRKGTVKLDIHSFGGVGFLSLLAGDRAGVDAVAVADCRALEVPAATALRVMAESFPITRMAIRSLARQLVDRWGAMPAGDSPESIELGSMREKPLTLVERLVMLRSTPLGKFANMDASAEMARGMTEQRVEAGDKLWSTGEPSTSWVGIEYGRVRCDAPDGETGWAGARKVLGVLEAWGDLPRPYTATAETSLVIHRIEVATMLAIAETHTAMGVHMSRFLARDLIASEDDEADDGGLRGHRRRGFLARPSVSHPPRDSEIARDAEIAPGAEIARAAEPPPGPEDSPRSSSAPGPYEDPGPAAAAVPDSVPDSVPETGSDEPPKP